MRCVQRGASSPCRKAQGAPCAGQLGSWAGRMGPLRVARLAAERQRQQTLCVSCHFRGGALGVHGIECGTHPVHKCIIVHARTCACACHAATLLLLMSSCRVDAPPTHTWVRACAALPNMHACTHTCMFGIFHLALPLSASNPPAGALHVRGRGRPRHLGLLLGHHLRRPAGAPGVGAGLLGKAHRLQVRGFCAGCFLAFCCCTHKKHRERTLLIFCLNGLLYLWYLGKRIGPRTVAVPHQQARGLPRF